MNWWSHSRSLIAVLKAASMELMGERDILEQALGAQCSVAAVMGQLGGVVRGFQLCLPCGPCGSMGPGLPAAIVHCMAGCAEPCLNLASALQTCLRPRFARGS